MGADQDFGKVHDNDFFMQGDVGICKRTSACLWREIFGPVQMDLVHGDGFGQGHVEDQMNRGGIINGKFSDTKQKWEFSLLTMSLFGFLKISTSKSKVSKEIKEQSKLTTEEWYNYFLWSLEFWWSKTRWTHSNKA